MTRKAVIFDLDGTLFDTLEDLADASNAALATLGHPPHPLASYRHFVGNGMRKLMVRALPEGAAADLDRAVAAMNEIYATNWKAKSRPYQGIPELLDALAGEGVALAVLSNKPDAFTRLIIEDVFRAWPWAAVIGDGQYPRKPDPAGALAIARTVGLDPSAMVLVGDTPMDVKCARDAGMRPVAVTWGFRPRAELEAAGADRFIDTPLELLGLL
uniref:HAD family hydrolase n=1 Tax=Fundidesulfovibrio putealis TaxID=270496 RepID=A0A7C3WCH2_9BACT